MSQETEKEALKALREAHKETIEAARERMKKNRGVQKQLSGSLSQGPKTVPEISHATGIPSHEVLWHLTSMKKYGKVAEGEQNGDYFQYILLKE